MNCKELIMNNKKSPVGAAWHAAQKQNDKNNITSVGADLVSAQENKYKNNGVSVGACIARPSGITLIALIITIIVMLILAGVVLSLTIGERGIFKTAKGAAKNYTNASEKELADLNKFDNSVNEILNGLEQGNVGNVGTNTPPKVQFPENTETTPSGTQVRRPTNKTWDETKINSYADGEGNTIPVPVGFTPITVAEGQGTKTSGFVIKDTSVNSDGTPTATNGNEFVWIPVEGMDYTYARHDFGYYTNGNYSEYSETMPVDEQTSVAKYGGYYIGRYEAGIEGGTLSSTTWDGTETWTGYTGGKLVVKKGMPIWNYITRDKAITESSRLYNKTDNNVASKLCSSYAWDTALKFIELTDNTYLTNSNGGRYGGDRVVATGTTSGKPCNIYDMGGNAWDWTTESRNDASAPCVIRGGSYYQNSSSDPATSRASSVNAGSDNVGFRVTLFM